MFKLDQSIIETIFDFLVNEEAIIEEEVEQWSYNSLINFNNKAWLI